jgi:acyl-coenzyme A thioesterase PaaI-like protein
MKSESWPSRLLRWRFNWIPVYRRTGGQVTYIATDLREVHVRIPLNWKTRNYVGTMYGGTMYSAVDPFYMVMLIRLLGPDYVVWDKSASIRFRRPARGTLAAKFIVTEEETQNITSLLAQQGKVEREYVVALTDADGVECAVVTKTVHVSSKKADRRDSS